MLRMYLLKQKPMSITETYLHITEVTKMRSYITCDVEIKSVCSTWPSSLLWGVDISLDCE